MNHNRRTQNHAYNHTHSATSDNYCRSHAATQGCYLRLVDAECHHPDSPGGIMATSAHPSSRTPQMAPMSPLQNPPKSRQIHMTNADTYETDGKMKANEDLPQKDYSKYPRILLDSAAHPTHHPTALTSTPPVSTHTHTHTPPRTALKK